MTTEHPDDLLAWYANGTLAGEELDKVNQHLAGCERCRAEVDLLRVVAREIRQEVVELAPVDSGWQRIRAQIQSQSDEDVPREGRLSRTWLRMLERCRIQSIPAWTQLALTAAVLVIVIQAGMLVRSWQSGPETALTTMSAVSEEKNVVKVQFAPGATAGQIAGLLGSPGATAGQIAGLLGSVGAQIIDGPSALGMYRVVIRKAETQHDLDAVIELLRSERAIVIYAEVD
jgi:anti-sigma factor RsiW